jgi:hypothetical protein
MGYEHESAPDTPAEPEVIVTQPGTNEHDVEIAKAEAEARIKSDQAYAKARDPEMEAENARLRGEIEGMRTTLAALQTPAESEPEVVAEVAPEVVVAEPAAEPAPDESPSPPEPKTKKKAGWWDAYKG